MMGKIKKLFADLPETSQTKPVLVALFTAYYEGVVASIEEQDKAISEAKETFAELIESIQNSMPGEYVDIVNEYFWDLISNDNE